MLYPYQKYIDDYNSGRREMTKPVSQVQVGDVIQSKVKDGHTAIVVHIVTWDAQGRVVAVEVVDSNFVGGAHNEIIGRHLVSTSGSGYGDLDNYIALDLAYQ
ncbi:MAG: hypothetical protein HYY50_03275 [Candidatus Kerfeldbacteria bacterium]|nr:hypothetical protein [Candidatus Kerfeldbacteria bacterium]